MKVSIIIPTYNEQKVIGECLESLKKQTYKDIEIIIVDDGSVDNTIKLIKNIKGVKSFAQDHKGPGSARNLGAAHAQGDILVFVDADMTFDKDFISELTRPIREEKTLGTFSKDELVSNNNNIWAQCWGINEGWEKGKRHSKNYPDKQKVFRAILKSEFDRVGGFSATGYTDDWTLAQKLGYEADAARAIFYHKNPDNLCEVFNQARWIGKRQYKLGNFGTLVALVRAWIPISMVVGLFKAIINLKPKFFVFKIFYDLGIFSGALSTLLGGNRAK